MALDGLFRADVPLRNYSLTYCLQNNSAVEGKNLLDPYIGCYPVLDC